MHDLRLSVVAGQPKALPTMLMLKELPPARSLALHDGQSARLNKPHGGLVLRDLRMDAEGQSAPRSCAAVLEGAIAKVELCDLVRGCARFDRDKRLFAKRGCIR